MHGVHEARAVQKNSDRTNRPVPEVLDSSLVRDYRFDL